MLSICLRDVRKSNKEKKSVAIHDEFFVCDSSGYIRHWLMAGTKVTPYTGQMGSENQLRLEIVDHEIVAPPGEIALGKPGPFGDPWRYYSPGQNIFVEQSGFYHELSVLDMYAATDVNVPEDMDLPISLWACGAADLWVNGVHVCRHVVPRYMYPEAIPITLSLKSGRNRLAARLQALGVRDTRFLFGVQALDSAEKLEIWIPGPERLTEKLVEMEAWLQGVRAEGRDTLRASEPAPLSASLKLRAKTLNWPTGEDRLTFDPVGQTNLVLSVEFEGQELKRSFDIPANRIIASSKGSSLEEHRRDVIRHIARSGRGVRNVLARHTLGERSDDDEDIIFRTLGRIDGRPDCADFDLATLLRLYMGDSLTEKERERVKQTALAFRYWSDEPGTDAMCFGSENHSLLFHGCQLIAGRMFPDEIFSNSGRTGSEQAETGRTRCLDWLHRVEENGFLEFLSSTYMPLTAAALLNLVDFSGDEDISRRAAALVDNIFETLAMHSFDGVTVGPQGRVYRGVLYPDSSGTQAMLAYAAPEAVVSHNDWLSFVAASAGYRPPENIVDLMRKPVSKLYRQAHVEIQLEKSSDYLLTSLQIPASFQKTRPGEAPPNTGRSVYPGMRGYQQHLWHATLGRDCQVFVNHPGASFDLSSSRPGFWYGNGVFPHIEQRGATIMLMFDIPESHPIHFTHAHWPSDAFDKQEIREHWAFGAKGTGYMALWCSQPLGLHSDVLTDRELRAYGLKVAWIGFCAGAGEVASFDSFVRNCINMRPEFHVGSLVLSLEGVRITVAAKS